MAQDREQQMLKASQIYPKYQQKVFVDGVLWGDRNPQNLWHDAQGDDLPEIDREVIVLCGNRKVCYGHRPNPKGWEGRNIVTNEITHYTPQTYDRGGWNIPDVKWWLDVELPVLENLV